jgi:two-component system, NarL family, response regulator NreC
MQKRIAVFLVDDHTVLREGLRALIAAQEDMEVTGEAEHGRNLAKRLQDCAADVVVMDVSMPGTSGARATAELRQARASARVIALTRHSERGYLQQMLENGASGYVLKQSPAADLIHAIRTVRRGGTYLDPSVAGKLIPGHATKRTASGADGHLTNREQEVVSMIALGYTNKEIASKLGISVKTVESHKAHVMEKLEIFSRAGLVRFAITQGWLA